MSIIPAGFHTFKDKWDSRNLTIASLPQKKGWEKQTNKNPTLALGHHRAVIQRVRQQLLVGRKSYLPCEFYNPTIMNSCTLNTN